MSFKPGWTSLTARVLPRCKSLSALFDHQVVGKAACTSSTQHAAPIGRKWAANGQQIVIEVTAGVVQVAQAQAMAGVAIA